MMCREPKQKSPSPSIVKSLAIGLLKGVTDLLSSVKICAGVKLALLKEDIALEKSHSIEVGSKRELLLPSFEVSECD